MKKRFLSFLLTAIMILTMMPVKAEAGGASTNWGKLNDALKGGAQSTVANVFEVDDGESGVRKIKLLSDITAGSGDTTLIVGIDKQIILDLNGFTINGKIDDSTSVGSVIKIPLNATLTLKDDSTGKTGTITGGSAIFGGGVDVSTGDTTRTPGGTFIMNGGTITQNSATQSGGGVYVNGGTFTMTGGTVTQNNAGAANDGGGVYVVEGSFTMTGDSVVSYNSAKNGGGVCIYKSTFTMSGNSQINNNNASNAYGAIYVQTSNLSISENSKIEGNNAKQVGGLGVAQNCALSMTGGRISGNTAITNFGGVFFGAGTLTLGGTAVITGNTVNGASSNVYLAKNMTFDINTPSSGMSIGVTMQTPGVFTSNPADGYLSYFSSDDSTYKVVYDTDKKLKLKKIPKYTTYENWQIKHEGNSWQWTENLQKVEDGLYIIEINWTGSGFNVASDGNPIKKDWFAPGELTIGDEVLPPVTVDVYLRVIDDETLKIGIGVDPAPTPTHNPVLVNGQAATETDAGYKSYYECTHCNKYYEDATGLIEITDLEVWKSKNGSGYIPSGNEINEAKTAAKAALDSENAKDPLTDASSVTTGKDNIIKATTLDEVAGAKNAAITAIQTAQAAELASAKNDAKAALDAEDAKDPLTDKAPVTTGKANIDAAATKATVESAKNAALEAIRNAQNGNSLATAQTAAQAALDAENAKDPLTDASSVTIGKENISKATTLDEVAGAKNAAITAIQTAQAAELASAKKDAKAALDAEDALAPLEDKTPVETGKSNIDAAATKAAVESAKNTAISAIQEAQAKNPEPAPKPVEVYYAPLVADLKANEEGVIEWKAGDSLPLEAVKLLVDKPELSLEFTFTYEGEEHTIYIPAGAFEKYYDVTIPWYGPAWLIQYFEKPEKEVIEYTIVSGDTLNALAEKFKCTVEEILALNPYISDKHWIYPNNKLLIPVQK